MFIYSVDGIDITSIVASENTTIKKSLCTTKFTSATNEVNFSVKSAKNIPLYKTLLTDILTKWEQDHRDLIPVTIQKNGNYVFRGYLDESTLNITSAKLPENLSLAARDKTILLDRNVQENWGYENTTRTALVQKLLTDSRCNIPLLATELPETKIVRAYAVQEDDNETYRSKIDTILKEAPGYVLFYSPENDGFYIKKIINTSETTEHRTVNYRLEARLQTQTKVYDNDGILLTYPTIEEKKDQNIYAHDIQLQINKADEYDVALVYFIGDYVTHDEDLYKCVHSITVPEQWTPTHWQKVNENIIIGDLVRPDYYYPEDADIKKTVFDYSVSGLDRAYITKESREQNKDLALILAKNCHYDLIAEPMITPSPALPNIEYEGIEYMPRKAWIVLKNTNLSTSNVTGFSITGDVVYRSKVNKLTAPVQRVSGIIVSTCTNPEEIDTQTISTDADAKEYANFLYNTKHFSSTISTWCETVLTSSLGEVVNVAHKETGIAMPSVVCSIDDESIGHNLRQYKITALSIKGYQEWTDDNIQTSTNPTSRQETSLPVAVTQFCYGSATEPDAEGTIIVGVNEDVLGTDVDIVGVEGVSQWTEETLPPQNNKYIWCRIGHYTPPKTKADIVDWAVFRLGNVPRIFELKVNTNTFIRNLRRQEDVTRLEIVPEISGYEGIVIIKCHINSEDGELYPDYQQASTILDIPYTIPDYVEKLVFVMEMINQDGELLKDVFIVNQKDETGNRLTFDSSQVAPENMPIKDDKGNYYIKGDSYVYYVEDRETKESNVCVFTGSEWTLLTNTSRDTMPEYDGILTDSLKSVFELYEGQNHVVANGYDWFKQIIAEYISGVVYYVKGYIYGGDTANFEYDEKGVPVSLNSRGFILSANGNLQVNNGDFTSINVKNANIENSVISGKFIANAFETFDETAQIDSSAVTTSDWDDVSDDKEVLDVFSIGNTQASEIRTDGNNVLCTFFNNAHYFSISVDNGNTWVDLFIQNTEFIRNIYFYNGYWYLFTNIPSGSLYAVVIYRKNTLNNIWDISNRVFIRFPQHFYFYSLERGQHILGFSDSSGSANGLIFYDEETDITLISTNNGVTWDIDSRIKKIIDITKGLWYWNFPSIQPKVPHFSFTYYDATNNKYYLQHAYLEDGNIRLDDNFEILGAYTNFCTKPNSFLDFEEQTYCVYNNKVYKCSGKGQLSEAYGNDDDCIFPFYYKKNDIEFLVSFGEKYFAILNNLKTGEKERVETAIGSSTSFPVYASQIRALQTSNGYIHVCYLGTYFRCRGIGYKLNKIIRYFTSIKNKLNSAWIEIYESTHGVGSFASMVEPLLSLRDVYGNFNFNEINRTFTKAKITANEIRVNDDIFTANDFSRYPIHLKDLVIYTELAKLQTLDIEPKNPNADIGRGTPFDEIHCLKLFAHNLPTSTVGLQSGQLYRDGDTVKIFI